MAWPEVPRRVAEAVRKAEPQPLAPPGHHDPVEVAEMLRKIGAALVEVSQPIQVIEERLHRIAARYTTEPVEVAVLPTMVFIQVGTTTHQMQSSVLPSGRLDMAARLDEIVALAAAGAITPRDAVAAVHDARTAPPRFGAVGTTVGYALTAVGFGMVVEPSWRALPAHLFLGLIVGLIVLLRRPLPSLAPILPTASALVVTMLAVWFVADVARDGLLRVIAPALIASLPGMALVIGAIELAGAKIISGSARVVYGLTQLGLLLYGVVIGVYLAGKVPGHAPSALMGPWSTYAAIVVIAVGFYLYLSAPRGSLMWLGLTIGVSILAQNLAGLVLNSAHSGFFAAMVAIPFAILISRINSAPPPSMLTLAAFYSLVPGQLTFMSVSGSAAGDDAGGVAAGYATGGVGVAATAVISIALGSLVGWSLVRTFTNLGRRQAQPCPD